jgi:hypothetical protein
MPQVDPYNQGFIVTIAIYAAGLPQRYYRKERYGNLLVKNAPMIDKKSGLPLEIIVD